MKLLIALCVGFMVLECNAQTNVYNCAIVDVPTQAEIDATILYSDQCILFDAPTIYSFGQTDNNTVKASSRIDVEPGFTSEAYATGAGMTLILCDDNRNVASFSQTDLSSIEALKKFEFGIELPENVNALVQEFITSGDTMNGEINPYLAWHLNAIATFTHRETGFQKIVYGFYFQDFERNTASTNTANWGWNQLPTTHPIRFRYAPAELEGIWDVSIHVELQNGSTIHYCPFVIRVNPNSSDDGYVKVAANNRVLERNEKLFFPIGQNLPWPEDEFLHDQNDPNSTENAYGVDAGAWAPNPVNSRAHKEYIEKMELYKAEGGSTIRLLLNPVSLDIEFEKVGDYTDRLNYGWEIDNIIEKAEELDLYLHFNLLVHNALQYNNDIRINWDWNEAPYPAYTGNSEYYAYRDFFGTQDNTPELFFDNAECIKYYKQKTRYLISRYGYSPHISMLELLSESNTAGDRNKYIATSSSSGINYHLETEYRPYLQDAAQPARLAAWHQTMAKYIKEELGHTEHIVTVSYAGSNIAPTDFSYGIPEIDVITWNEYSTNIQKYHLYTEKVNAFFEEYHKPILWSETGPVIEMNCSAGSTYRKDTWMSAFTGIAGFNQWSGFYTPQYWNHLATTQNFIEGNADAAQAFLGDWTSHYTNTTGKNSLGHWLPAFQKEANYIEGFATDVNGVTSRFKMGVVSNLTDNYFTNISFGDVSSWCALTQPSPNQLTMKANINWGDLSVITNSLGDYIYNWYDQEANYLSSSTYYLHQLGYFPHPLSCVEGSCNSQTSEIPFTLNWDYSDINKSANNSIPTQFREKPVHNTTNALQMNVWPNPSSTHLNISCEDPEITEFVLLDAMGKGVESYSKEEILTPIDISNLERGLFVILGLTDQQTTKYRTPWLKL